MIVQVHLQPYPFVEDPNEVPRDGFWLKVPSYCHRARREKCARHYTSIADRPGPHVCPFGFSSYVEITDGESIIHTGLRIPGHSDRKLLKSRTRGDFVPKVPLSVFVKSLNQLGAVSVLISENERLLAEAKDEGLASREFIDDLMHEIRKLNGQIKHQAEEAQAKLEESHPATYRVNNIFATSSLISVRMNSYDLTVNPDLILHEEQTRVKLYSKFRKTSHILDALSRKRRIKIELIGASFRSIDGYAIFDLVPYVLLDNAIKFSPDDQTISVVFDETAMHTTISVCSFGPALESGEELSILNKGVRGANATKVGSGSGLGLYVARIICELHGITMAIESRNDRTTEVNSVPYCEFIVTLLVPHSA